MVVALCQLFRWSISCVPLLISSSFVALSLVGLLVVSTASVFPATTFGFFVAGDELDWLAVLRERLPARPFALSCFCRGFISHCVGQIHSLWILLFRSYVPLSSHSFASSTSCYLANIHTLSRALLLGYGSWALLLCVFQALLMR